MQQNFRIGCVFLKSIDVLRVWSYPLFWVGAANSNSLFCVPLFFAIKENRRAWAILDKENPNRDYFYNQMQSYAWYFTLWCLNLTVVYICFWVWWCDGCCGAKQRHQVLKRCLLTNFEEVKVDTGHLLCETTKILAIQCSLNFLNLWATQNDSNSWLYISAYKYSVQNLLVENRKQS